MQTELISLIQLPFHFTNKDWFKKTPRRSSDRFRAHTIPGSGKEDEIRRFHWVSAYFSGAFPVKTLGGYTLEHCHDFFLEHQKMGGDCTDFKLSGLEVNRPWLPGIFSNVSYVSYTDG